MARDLCVFVGIPDGKRHSRVESECFLTDTVEEWEAVKNIGQFFSVGSIILRQTFLHFVSKSLL